MTDSPNVLVDRQRATLVITINRPASRNAVDRATAEEIERAMDRLDAEPSLFVGVLTGAGSTFCAGADLKAVARGERAVTARRGGFGLFARPPRKPLIAAVEGVAAGGGFEACLACDLIVAARDARFGLPEVRHNVVAVGGGLFRLPRALPYHLAMELALSGTLRDADFFHRWGVVNRLVEPGHALAEALSLAESLQANGPTAMAASKEIMFQSRLWQGESEAWEKQWPIAERALKSADFREGLAAFIEKRQPRWTGE